MSMSSPWEATAAGRHLLLWLLLPQEHEVVQQPLQLLSRQCRQRGRGCCGGGKEGRKCSRLLRTHACCPGPERLRGEIGGHYAQVMRRGIKPGHKVRAPSQAHAAAILDSDPTQVNPCLSPSPHLVLQRLGRQHAAEQRSGGAGVHPAQRHLL